MLFPVTLTSILFTIILIVLSCLSMARFRGLFEKVKVPFGIIALLGGLTVYTLGYLPPGLINGEIQGMDRIVESGTVILRALFSTCRSFIMESDFGEINEDLKQNSLYILAFSITHILALLLTVMTVLSLFGMRFIARLQLLIARSRDVFLFIGINEAASQLITDIHKNGANRTLLLIERIPDEQDEEKTALIQKARDDGVILIEHDPKEITSLKKLGIRRRLFKKQINFFFLFSDENQNVKAALKALDLLHKEKMPQGDITFYLQSTTDGMEKILDKTMEDYQLKVEVKLFSVPDISARQLMESCPIYETLELDTQNATVKSDFTMLIAGFGQTGVEVLRKSLYCGQFMGGNFKAIVADQCMKNKEGAFQNKYSGISSNYDVTFHEAHSGSQALFDLLARYGSVLNYIVIALGEDQKNIETAIEVSRMIKRRMIRQEVVLAVHIRKPDEYLHFRLNDELSCIRFFGGLSDIFTENIIINEAMDKMARKMNAMFNQIYHVEPADNWGALDVFTKESNRSAAMNIRTKLKLLGLDMAEKGESAKQPVALKDYLTESRLDHLARQEHMRWNAFHFASGWDTWHLKDTGEAKKAKDLKRKRHACLVSWEGLRAVTEHFKQNPTYEELDYEQVRNIPDILEYAGYEVYQNAKPVAD